MWQIFITIFSLEEAIKQGAFFSFFLQKPRRKNMEFLMLIYFFSFRSKSSVLGGLILTIWYWLALYHIFIITRVLGNSIKKRPTNKFIPMNKMVITQMEISRLTCKNANTPTIFQFMLPKKSIKTFQYLAYPFTDSWGWSQRHKKVMPIQYNILFITYFGGI